MDKRIKQSFIVSVILLTPFLILKLIERSNLISTFPLDFINDISSYMARLYFLAEYGFHKTIPLWYSGNIEMFTMSTPGWSFFTLPIYLITNSIQLSAYISILILFILGLIFILSIGKTERISRLKSFALYLFLFANPLFIGNFLRLGKVTELFGWVLFTAIFAVLLNIKKRPKSIHYLMLFLAYSLIIISYQPIAMFSTFLIASLFFIVKKRDRIKLIISSILGITITSFWWIPYLKNTLAGNFGQPELFYTSELITKFSELLFDNIAGFIIPSALLFLAYFYLKTKKEKIFYSPIIILAILFLTRIITFIPILNNPHPDTYNILFLFFSLFFFFKTRDFQSKLDKLILFIPPIIALSTIIISILIIPPYLEHTEENKITLEIIKNLDGRYIIEGGNSYPQAYYSYGAIFYQKPTSAGFAIEETPRDYLEKTKQPANALTQRNCPMLIGSLNEIETPNIIAYNSDCGFLKHCNLTLETQEENVCLYSLHMK